MLQAGSHVFLDTNVIIEAHRVGVSDVLVKGPYVTLTREFAKGNTLLALLADNVGYPELAALSWPFGDAPLFSPATRGGGA